MNSSDYTIQPISLNKIKITDNFWATRIKINHDITIPYLFDQCELTGRIDNFSRAAGLLKDKKRPIFPFDDSDLYKIIEGTAYSLIQNPNSKLENYIDNLIDKIAAAQEDDGYLYTTRTINPYKPHIWAGKNRWELVSVFSHELYNLGHLIETAIAYYQATGKEKLLDIAIKSADLIDKNFGFGKFERFPGHEEIELALVKLYKQTNNEKYSALAKFFLDIRGSKETSEYKEYLKKFEAKFPFPTAKSLKYNQSHKKIIEQDEAVGHAVRATYLYSAITDIAPLFNDAEYIKTVNRIWENVISKKIYITGGLGARKFAYGEGFWDNYKLPNFDSYNETCAAIGNIFWNHRLFLLYEDAKYIDVLERTLYNGFLVGIGLDGKSFFYSNHLSSRGKILRKSWYKIPCCPTNISRFIPQIPSYAYARKDDSIFVNLFIGSEATLSFGDNTEVSFIQDTNYPWDGDVKISIGLPQSKEFTIALRIPGWTQNNPVPSDLYHYLEPNELEISLKINNELVDFQIEKGFAKIWRTWNDNDVIEFHMPMPIRRVLSHTKVEDNVGKVAIERGPIVYCVESVDNDVESIFNFILKDTVLLREDYRSDLLNGIVVITGTINYLNRYENDKEISNNKQDFLAIPYYAWANRGKSQMTVWIQHDSTEIRQ